MEKIGQILFWRRKASSKTLLNANTKYSLKLIEKEEISPDTKRFRLALPSERHYLGSPIGQHIYLSATINGKFVPRPYTPISSDDDKGYVDLVVKIYYKNVHPDYPEGGLLSQYLDDLEIGESIQVQGPTGNLIYLGQGKFSIRPDPLSQPNHVQIKRLSMIAGGTGITPMLQLMRNVTKNLNDRTQMRLIFANRAEDDILMRLELKELARNHPGRLQIWFTLSAPPQDWKFSVGYINEKMISDHLFPPSPENLVLICGPPALIDKACMPSLEKLGYDQSNIFVY